MARKVSFVDVADAQRRAAARLPRFVLDYVEGGADDEWTVARNDAAWSDVTFRPRVLQDVSERSHAVEILGRTSTLPLVLAPTGLTGLVHADGEVAVARAAAAAGVPYALSTGSSRSIEEVAGAGGSAWFQLYLWRDRDLLESFVERAATSGFHALCVTVDVPVSGNRRRDIRNRMVIPPRVGPRFLWEAARHPRWSVGQLRGPAIGFGNVRSPSSAFVDRESLATFAARMMNASATWDAIAWARSLWQGPLVLKGILTGEDARRAVDHGADGIVVSNHGGRQLDTGLASVEALPEVVAAVRDEAEVFVDGGVRRGSDLAKARCLGATACLIGRPHLYGLAVAGERGVGGVIDVLRSEFDRTLALLGVPSPDGLGPALVQWRAGRADTTRAPRSGA